MNLAVRAGGAGDLMNRIYRRQRFVYDLRAATTCSAGTTSSPS
jgi:hypothetical protein